MQIKISPLHDPGTRARKLELESIKENLKTNIASYIATHLVIAKRVFILMSGMGLSINGKHIYCGDYIFSGHTMTLTMAYLAVKQCEESDYRNSLCNN